MAKLAETTYRDVNIGLANQFAKFADKAGIDVYAVIEACNSQPYSHIHQPGIAVGGHCIPVYPRLYLHNDPGCDDRRRGPGGQCEHAGVRGSATRGGVRGPGGCEGRRAGRRLPRGGQGDRLLRGVPASSRHCARAGRTLWSTTRCSLMRSCGFTTSSHTTWAILWMWRFSKRTIRSTPNWILQHCPASGRSWMGVAHLHPPTGAALRMPVLAVVMTDDVTDGD